jgi:hypothetical protein
MENLTNEITRLSDIWCRFVGGDHHKDRDCHFYITKHWSYGDVPYYKASHYGYIADCLEGTNCTTEQEAAEELLNFLRFQIHDAIKWTTKNLEDTLERVKNDEMYMYSPEEYERNLKILKEA